MTAEAAREWVKKAEEDYEAANVLYSESKRRFASIICYHAQQAVEKYLKAILVYYDIEPMRTHDLAVLYDIITARTPITLDDIYDELESLVPYSVETRYPGTVCTEHDAEHCIEILNNVRQNIFKVFEILNLKEGKKE